MVKPFSEIRERFSLSKLDQGLLNTGSWPGADDLSLPKDEQDLFVRRSNAVKAYIKNDVATLVNTALQAVYYFATWCDWYLKSSRPNMSQQCVRSQILINELSVKNKKIKWRGVATRLWTNEEDVRKYAHKFNVSHPLEIDTTNQEIFASRIRVFPTLVLLENGKEIYRTTAFDETEMCKSRTELCKQQG